MPVGSRVAVIGGGNTAIDAVTQARRLGAQTAAILYRRGEADMSAYDFEYELAKNDGAQFLFHAAPLEVVADAQGHVAGLRLARTRIDPFGKVELVPGTESIEPFDMVIKAIGQEKQAALLKALFPKLEIDKRGAIKYDFATGQHQSSPCFRRRRLRQRRPRSGQCGGRGQARRARHSRIFSPGKKWLARSSLRASARWTARSAPVSTSPFALPNWRPNSQGTEAPMADLSINLAGIKSPNPFWVASGPPSNTAYQAHRAFEAGWGGVVWKTIGDPIVNVSSRYSALNVAASAHGRLQQHRTHQRPLA